MEEPSDVSHAFSRKRLKMIHSASFISDFTSQSTSNVARLSRMSRPTSTPFASFSRGYRSNDYTYQYSRSPPTKSELLDSLEEYGLPSKVYKDPYYSKASDAPDRPREYAGLLFYIKGGEGVGALEEWTPSADKQDHAFSQPLPKDGVVFTSNDVWGWEFANSPPNRKEVSRWLREEGREILVPERRQHPSQVGSPWCSRSCTVVLRNVNTDRGPDPSERLWIEDYSHIARKCGCSRKGEHGVAFSGGVRYVFLRLNVVDS